MDFNLTTSDATDDYTLLFHYPADRKNDAWPGWYQRYTTTFDFDTDPALAGVEVLSFEIANWGCSNCEALPENYVDIVIDFYYEEIEDEFIVDSGHRYFLMRETGFEEMVFNDKSSPMTDWQKSSGKYEVAITMYSITKPDSRRHGFFRFVDVSDELPVSGNYPTVDVSEWDFETGIWTADSADPDYIELPWGLDGYWALGTSGYDTTYIGLDEDDLYHGYFIDAAPQARDLMECIDRFWASPLNWSGYCVYAGDW